MKQERAERAMRRWLAGLLAVIILLPIGAAWAENSGKDTGTLAESIRFVSEIFQDEEVRSILSREDVQEICRELIVKTALWMIENRPVTMKILAEMGVSGEERGYIETVWDSFERIRKASQEYGETEDGKLLKKEFEEVWNDPDVKETAEMLVRFLTSGDLLRIIGELHETGEADPEDAEPAADAAGLPEGPLTQAARERQMDVTTLSGQALAKILQLLEESRWGEEYLPRILSNEKVWTLILHLANRESSTVQVIFEEFDRLSNDPALVSFLQRTVQELFNAKDELLDLVRGIPDSGNQNGTGQKEEAAP